MEYSTLQNYMEKKMGEGRIKVKLLEKDAVQEIHSANNNKRMLVRCKVADATRAVQLMVYNTEVHKLLDPGKGLLLINPNIGSQPNQLIIRTNDKLFKTTPPNVPAAVEQSAANIHELPTTPISDVKEKGIYRVEVEIMHDTAPIQGAKKLRRTLKVTDKSGTMEVTLWDQQVHSPVKTGDRVTITGASSSKFGDNVKLNLNDRFDAKIIPIIETKQDTITVEAYDVKEHVTTIIDDTGIEFAVQHNILAKLFDLDDFDKKDIDSCLENTIPFQAKVTQVNKNVTNMVFSED